MGVYVVTGGSGGIGANIVRILRERGNEVINVDLVGGDIVGDLSTPEGRQEIVDEINRMHPEGIDGLACNAGVNGFCKSLRLIVSLNYFGTAALARMLWSSLEKKGGNIVVTSSNSIIQGRGIDIGHLIASGTDEEIILKMVDEYDPSDPSSGHDLYVATKYAQALWVRRMSATSAARGVRVNAVAPGNVRTPMTEGADEATMASINALPMPTKYGRDSLQDPAEIAKVICFLISDESEAVNGVILFCDGGHASLLDSDRVC